MERESIYHIKGLHNRFLRSMHHTYYRVTSGADKENVAEENVFADSYTVDSILLLSIPMDEFSKNNFIKEDSAFRGWLIDVVEQWMGYYTGVVRLEHNLESNRVNMHLVRTFAKQEDAYAFMRLNEKTRMYDNRANRWLNYTNDVIGAFK